MHSYEQVEEYVHESYRSPGGDNRGISEILGTVLLLSMVLVGSAVVVVIGSGAISDVREGTQTEAAETHLQDIDARLATLSADSDSPTTEIDLSDTHVRDYSVERDGWINVTVNGNGTTSFERNLTTIRYEDTQGNRVAYEAGGVWRGGMDSSSPVTSPGLTFEEGSLDVTLVNLTGHVDKDSNAAVLDLSESRNATERVVEWVTQGRAMRPDNLTISVNSEFQSGWANYLEGEIGTSNVQTFSNGTVRVDVGQSLLHPSTNDSLNNVVDLSDPDYMDLVDLDYNGDHPTVTVDKGEGNTYSVFVEPLSEDSLEVGRLISIEGDNVTGPPLDVSIVLDQSGSMSYAEDGERYNYPYNTCWDEWTCESRAKLAMDAATNFTGSLNDSRDRISFQGFSSNGFIHKIDEQYFSTDFDAVNDTIESDGEPMIGEGTRIDRGLDESNAVFDLRSDETRRKVTVLLTDGMNDGCQGWGEPDDEPYDCADNRLTREHVWQADNSSITVHTIGFGAQDEIDHVLMADLANRTGGSYYHATDAEELEDAFENIRDNIRAEDVIAKTPLTTNMSTADGRAFAPEIPGEVSHIASVSDGDETFLNINDPTAPRLFSHSFAVQGGDHVKLNMTGYECRPGAWNYTGQVRERNGQTYSEARCTDIGSTNGSFNSRIYIDGERPEWLLGNDNAPWERDVNDSLDAFPSVDIDDSTGELSAKSNQALVVYDVPPEGPDTSDNDERNKIALLFQIGLADSEARGDSIVDVRINEVTVD